MDQMSPYLWILGLGALLGYALFAIAGDTKLERFGKAAAPVEEESKISFLGGGRYLTIFPIFTVFAPGDLKLKAIYRKPPVIPAIFTIYGLRWALLYYGASPTLLIITSGVLLILLALLGVSLIWAVKGTPCWIYDEKRTLLFKIRRQLGFFAYRFIVFDAQSEVIGYLRMSSLSNLYRKQWWILDKESRTVGHILEDSVIKSMIRRLIGHLWGLLRANFTISSQNLRIGKIKSAMSPYNRLSVNAQCPRALDPRLLLCCVFAMNLFNRDRWYPFWSS